MKIVLVAATTFEIAPLLAQIEEKGSRVADSVFRVGKHEIGILITGVGQAHTALMLGRLLRSSLCDLALQVGVGGSYSTSFELGSVVEIVSDRFADLGAEDQDGSLIDMYQLGLIDGENFPYSDKGWLVNRKPIFNDIPHVQGLTVNKVNGSAPSIEKIKAAYSAQIESMEGAAFMLACLTEGVPFAQLRAISNYVEPRDRNNWRLDLAVKNLNEFLWVYFSHN
jgi:futalosine hydrolase